MSFILRASKTKGTSAFADKNNSKQEMQQNKKNF